MTQSTTRLVTDTKVKVASVLIETANDNIGFQRSLSNAYQDALATIRFENRLPEIHFSTVAVRNDIIYSGLIIWIAEA